MISPKAIQRFTERQRQLIHDSYDRAWRQGVEGYEPDADPATPSDPESHAGEEATLSGAALLIARSQRAYKPPASPDMARRQEALAGALRSTEAMAGELATVAPTPGQLDAADGVAAAALAAAVAAWAESNSYRLELGQSVAWAGEQAGYAEAASQDGQLLAWSGAQDANECVDCFGLEELGPLPLSEFPTTPGAGATECNVGCRCSLEATGVPLEDELSPLTDANEATLDKVAVQAGERQDATMPNFAAAVPA